MSNLMQFALETTSGDKHDVTAVFADLIKYDILRARLNYPPRDQSEFLFMGLVAFCALHRIGAVKNETKPEEFLNTIASIELVEDEAEEAPFRTDGDNK